MTLVVIISTTPLLSARHSDVLILESRMAKLEEEMRIIKEMLQSVLQLKAGIQISLSGTPMV